MPDLLIFAPCQKAVVASDDGQLSLISIIDALTVGIPAGVSSPPKGTTIPVTWDAFTLWRAKPEDVGIVYEQQFSLIAQGQDLIGDPSIVLGGPSIHELSFQVAGEYRRIYNRIQGFPVWIEGQCDLKLRFRVKGQEWRDIASYPLTVIYRHQKPSSEDAGN